MIETRERIVTASLELFRRKGYNGTSLKDITVLASATTGSLYHFWPGGKDELTAHVLSSAGTAYGELFVSVLSERDDLAEAVEGFFAAGADVLEATDFIDPCPIGTIAREIASTHEHLRRAALAVFEGWISKGATIFESAGITPHESHDLAATLVATIEGGFVLARTARDTTAFRRLGVHMGQLVASSLSKTVPQA